MNIQDEATLETNFSVKPPLTPYETLRGWYLVTEQKGKTDEMAALIAALAADMEEASRAGKKTGAPPSLVERRLPIGLRSRHEGEHHLGTLVAQSYRLLEAHATGLSASLKREHNQDVIAYVRSLQNTLQLSKDLCDSYVEAYARSRWAGPHGAPWTGDEFTHFEQRFRALLKEIDARR